MAQQMTRRVRRAAASRKRTWWRGVLVSVAFTLAAVAVFAVLIGFTAIGDGVIRIVNQLIKLGAIFLGVRSAVEKGDANAIRKGVLVGLIYMGVGVLLYAVLSSQKLTLLGYAIDLLMGVAAGGLSGMIVGGRQR